MPQINTPHCSVQSTVPYVHVYDTETVIKLVYHHHNVCASANTPDSSQKVCSCVCVCVQAVEDVAEEERVRVCVCVVDVVEGMCDMERY